MCLYRDLRGDLSGTIDFRSLLAAQSVSFRVHLVASPALDWRRCIQIMANGRSEDLGPIFSANYAFMFLTSRHNKDCWTAKRYASDPLYISDCPLPWRTIVALVLEAGINVYKQEILDVSFISLWDMLRPDLHHQHLVTCWPTRSFSGTLLLQIQGLLHDCYPRCWVRRLSGYFVPLVCQLYFVCLILFLVLCCVSAGLVQPLYFLFQPVDCLFGLLWKKRHVSCTTSELLSSV